MSGFAFDGVVLEKYFGHGIGWWFNDGLLSVYVQRMKEKIFRERFI